MDETVFIFAMVLAIRRIQDLRRVTVVVCNTPSILVCFHIHPSYRFRAYISQSNLRIRGLGARVPRYIYAHTLLSWYFLCHISTLKLVSVSLATLKHIWLVASLSSCFVQLILSIVCYVYSICTAMYQNYFHGRQLTLPCYRM